MLEAHINTRYYEMSHSLYMDIVYNCIGIVCNKSDVQIIIIIHQRTNMYNLEFVHGLVLYESTAVSLWYILCEGQRTFLTGMYTYACRCFPWVGYG